MTGNKEIDAVISEITNPGIYMDPTEKAIKLAKILHKGQVYGDQDYFWSHLYPVAQLVNSEIQDLSLEYRHLVNPIAILHDSIEDTIATKELLTKIFGQHIAMGVDNLSDVPGKNRRERKLKTYYKIRMSPESTMVKVADRLVNMENCEQNNHNLLGMYLREHDTFYAALWNPNQSYQHWWEKMNAIYERNK